MWRHCSGVGPGCCRIGSNQDSVFGCHRSFLDVQEKLEWWESEKANCVIVHLILEITEGTGEYQKEDRHEYGR
jgi:hypothetical protein